MDHNFIQVVSQIVLVLQFDITQKNLNLKHFTIAKPLLYLVLRGKILRLPGNLCQMGEKSNNGTFGHFWKHLDDFLPLALPSRSVDVNKTLLSTEAGARPNSSYAAPRFTCFGSSAQIRFGGARPPAQILLTIRPICQNGRENSQIIEKVGLTEANSSSSDRNTDEIYQRTNVCQFF